MTVLASTKQKLQQEDKQRKQSEVVDDVVLVGVVGTAPSLPAHCLRVETYTNQGSLFSA